MKNLLLSVLFVAFFTISNSSSAQTILGISPRFNYLDFSANTSDVMITTGQLERFYIIIDDSIKLKVVGRPSWGRCMINNVPKGIHTFVVVRYLGWSDREIYKHEFTILSTGNGERIIAKLPMPWQNSNNSELQLVLVALAGLGYLMKLVFL
jgi:hypothetical protein